MVLAERMLDKQEEKRNLAWATYGGMANAHRRTKRQSEVVAYPRDTKHTQLSKQPTPTPPSAKRESMSVLPFVQFHEGRYKLCDDAVSFLTTRERPFAVAIGAGKFRTGKSFLLNRLADNPAGQGFGVGETIQACTRGIWLCTNVIEREDHDVIVMDTEGIDAPDAESQHDVRVFAIAVLICSSFIYNQMSHLDEPAVQTLSLMTKVAACVGEAAHSPTLYWVLRDFSLQMVDSHGKKLNNSEYLEQTLTPSSSSKCATREAIVKLFKKRHLVTLPRPHKGEEGTAQRIDLSLQLNDKFKSYLSTFRAHLCEHSTPVSAAKVPMTGAVYSTFVKGILDRVNEDGCIPTMEDSWTLVTRAQHADAEARLLRTLKQSVEAECPVASLASLVQWAREKVGASLSGVQWMGGTPPPEAEGRLLHSLVEACKAHGKERDSAAKTKEVLLRFAETCDATALSAEVSTDACLAKGIGVPLCGVLPQVLHKCVQKGRREGEEARTLKGMQAEEDLVHAVEESRRLAGENARLVETVGEMTSKVQVSVATMTEEWRGEEKEGNGEEGEGTGEEGKGTGEEVLHQLEETLRHATERAEGAEQKLEAAKERERNVARAFDLSLLELREEATSKIDHFKAKAEEATSRAEAAEQQKAALEGWAADAQQRAASLTREAQEKAVEVHRTTLEELKRRDAQVREQAEGMRKEWGELQSRAANVEAENRGLKRKVGEMAEAAEEGKRARKQLTEAQGAAAKERGANDTLRSQLSQMRGDVEEARRANLGLETKVAVLEASVKLDQAKKALL